MMDITTHEGYMARFWELVTEKQDQAQPHREAWISLEHELSEQHGVRRYQTYGSFRTAKYKCKLKPLRRSRFLSKITGHPESYFVAQM